VFSKFLVAVPIKNKEASTITEHLLKDVFKILGPPMILQSDNGKEFVARIVTEICGALNITIRHSRPHYPQSQGQIERLNQTVGRGFTKLLWDKNNQLQRKDWINVIDVFMCRIIQPFIKRIVAHHTKQFLDRKCIVYMILLVYIFFITKIKSKFKLQLLNLEFFCL